MAKQGIITGTNPNDGLGDSLLTGAIKINSNFSEIYNTFGNGTNLVSYVNTSGIATYATNAGVSTYATNAGIATYATNAGIATYATTAAGAVYAATAGEVIYAATAGIATYATNAGIATYATNAGISTNSQGLTGTPNITVGIVTATSFVGDGSALTGVVGSGSGVIIKDSGSLVGTAGTIDFGDNLTVSAISAGIVTVTASGGSSGIATYATSAGIATYATNAGISTYATSSGIATYATSSGIATYATNAGTATSVIGGIASVTQLNVSGVTTISGGIVVPNYGADFNSGISLRFGNSSEMRVYYYGILNEEQSIIESFSNRPINFKTSSNPATSADAVTRLSVTNSGINVSGIVTATSGFVGNVTGNINSSGVSTVTSLNATNINVSGVSTLSNLQVDNGGAYIFGNVGIGTTNPTSKLSVIGDVSVTGISTFSSRVDLKQITETVSNNFNTSLAPVSGTLTVDTSAATVVLGDLNASVTTWAFTNVPAVNNKATTVTVIIDGDTSQTYGDACNVNGSAVSGGVKWAAGTSPDASNNFDIITFTIVRDGAGTINVFGSGNTDFS